MAYVSRSAETSKGMDFFRTTRHRFSGSLLRSSTSINWEQFRLFSFQITWLDHQVYHRRELRSIQPSDVEPKFNDPLYPQQWYLHGYNVRDQHHLNVSAGWSQGLSGRGISLTILDNIIKGDNPEIAANYVSSTIYITFPNANSRIYDINMISTSMLDQVKNSIKDDLKLFAIT